MTNISWATVDRLMAPLGSGGVMQEVAQSVQAGFPAPAPIGDPLLGGGHRRWFDPTHACSPDLLGLDYSARFEDLHVLDDHCEGHRQRLGQFTDRGGSRRESFHHAAPALVGQRLEGPIQVDRLVKHLLECTGPAVQVKFVLNSVSCPRCMLGGGQFRAASGVS